MITIDKKRLAQLEEKERAHDDYLAATRKVRARSASVELSARTLSGSLKARGYADGYRQCLEDFAQAILDAADERRRLEPAVPDAPSSWPPALLDGRGR